MILKDYTCSWFSVRGWHMFKLYHDEHDRFHLAIMRLCHCYWYIHGEIRVEVDEKLVYERYHRILKRLWSDPDKCGERHTPTWRTLLKRRVSVSSFGFVTHDTDQGGST